MRSTSTGSGGTFLRVAALMLGLALILSCGVGNDSPNPNTPTGIGEGSGDVDGWPVDGTLSIFPGEVDFTVVWPNNGAGHYFYFTVVGGKAPYYWDHSWQEMGTLMPLDLDGDGIHERAKYTIKDFYGQGDDEILIVDGAGALTSATFTKTIEEPEPFEPPALAIVPNVAKVDHGDTIVLKAVGGEGGYQWASSDTAHLSFTGANAGPSVSLVGNNTTGADVTVTVTVYDLATNTTTAAITVRSQ